MPKKLPSAPSKPKRSTPENKVTRTKLPPSPKIERFEIIVNTNEPFHKGGGLYEKTLIVEELTAAAAVYKAMQYVIDHWPKAKIETIEVNDRPDTELIFVPFQGSTVEPALTDQTPALPAATPD